MNTKNNIGWIGIGRMGEPMVEKILEAGYQVSIWNRTSSKAEVLMRYGAEVVNHPQELSKKEILFTMVSKGSDLDEILFGQDGVMTGGDLPSIIVDCSSIGVEDSMMIRKKLEKRGCKFLAAPVSGNAKCVRAGKLSTVVSGPESAFHVVSKIIESYSKRGVSFVGEGELARFCKIAHNVLLAVVTQNLAEITILAEKGGISRKAFLSFINNSVMGSIFSRYKTPAFVNLDWTTTFTPELLRKDVDLGLSAARELNVSMPITAATREALQTHFGLAQSKDDPENYLAQDFSALLETVASQSGINLESENAEVSSGLEENSK
ncbi:MAG: 6-phosphogluconate dehydrogenase [Magnetovibrio sp.]|jgi:3-hydroxyisobutyrate dehydrogenase|nr:6-phosphogluconate dehydrogenase [Magnetovibrio sp.]